MWWGVWGTPLKFVYRPLPTMRPLFIVGKGTNNFLGGGVGEFGSGVGGRGD